MGLEDSVGDAIATQKNPFRLKPVHFIPFFGFGKYIFPDEETAEAMRKYERKYEIIKGGDLSSFTNCAVLFAYNAAMIPAAALGLYALHHLFK